MIINHLNSRYRMIRELSGNNKYNGAYYYSKEICDRIIPNIETDYNWITVNVEGYAEDHSIVFIHNNLHPEYYDWLKRYKDLVLVCGIPETAERMKYLGRTIYLPLSINVAEVEAYRRKKTRDTAFAGRKSKRKDRYFGSGVEYLEGLPREALLARMAVFRNIYAVGRTAIEAACLGCKILPYDDRFPDPSIWKVIDNLEAAKMLQEELNKL